MDSNQPDPAFPYKRRDIRVAQPDTMQPLPEEGEPSPDDIPTHRDTLRSTAATAQTVMHGASKWLKQVGSAVSKGAQEAAAAAGHTAQEAALTVSGAVDQYSSQVRRSLNEFVRIISARVCNQ